MKVTFLGTGTSVGVPVIGCRCEVCTSQDPRDRRLRPSLWIQDADRSILVDTSSDLRRQALRYGIDRLDAVLYTHAHADHILGLDEVRIYNYRQKQTLPVYGSSTTLENLRRTFWYVFEATPVGGGKPRIETVEIEAPFRLGDLEIRPVPLWHGSLPVTGYRIGDFAYCTDTNRIPPEGLEILEGVRVLVIDALRDEDHPTHFTVEQALAAVERIGPEQAWLTHMTHDLAWEALEARTPDHVHPAYDGLELQL